MRGIIIEVDGEIGCGKSTVIDKIKKCLEDEYKISIIDILNTTARGFDDAISQNDIVIYEKKTK